MSDNEPSGESGVDAQQPYYVREIDDHTGVAEVAGIPYTYEHVDEPPEAGAEVYRIVGVVEFTNRPHHKNVYYVKAQNLDWFFDGWGSHGEHVVDMQRLSREEADRELAEFGGGD